MFLVSVPRGNPTGTPSDASAPQSSRLTARTYQLTAAFVVELDCTQEQDTWIKEATMMPCSDTQRNVSRPNGASEPPSGEMPERRYSGSRAKRSRDASMHRMSSRG